MPKTQDASTFVHKYNDALKTIQDSYPDSSQKWSTFRVKYSVAGSAMELSLVEQARNRKEKARRWARAGVTKLQNIQPPFPDWVKHGHQLQLLELAEEARLSFSL